MPLQLNSVTGGVDVGNAAANINEGKIGAINFGHADGFVINPDVHLDLNLDLDPPANEMKIGVGNAGNVGVLGVVDPALGSPQINLKKPVSFTFTGPAKGLVKNAVPGATIIFQHADVELKEINNTNGKMLDLSSLNPPCEVEVCADHFEINPIEVSVAAVEDDVVEEVAVNEMNVNFAALVLADNLPVDAHVELAGGDAEECKENDFEG